MNKKELQDQIDLIINTQKKVSMNQILSNFLKNEAFIHIKELNFVIKNKEKSLAIYSELQKSLPEITIELCPYCNNIINYFNKNGHNYDKCPKCSEEFIQDKIKTKIIINYKHLKRDNKFLLLEDIKTKIKHFDLKESISEILEIDDNEITELYNSKH